MASDTNQSAWGGRFSEATDAQVQSMNASIAFDQRLAMEDIAGSIAHSRMLAATGLISPEEQQTLEGGLIGIAHDIRSGSFTFTEAREDVHMNVEGALAERVGDVAGKLHSGRSRNDQVALDLRLWLRRELTETAQEILAVVEALVELSETHADLPMPGYTHLQRAQPITFGHHLNAYGAMMLRDVSRLLDARDRAAELPLGAGALAGTPLPIDRERVARELEDSRLTLNSLDTVSDRDAALETLSALSIFMVHVSRLAEEMVLWTSQEFGFVTLSDAFCTGSSLMPQKKNPDIPELLRGKSGRVFGALQSLLVVMKGLPLAYNKDMQEDKEPLFDAMDTSRMCARVLPALLRAMKPQAAAMKAALSEGFLLATDLADHLVAEGVPFREAHHIIGRAVAHCLDRSCALEDLTLEELRQLDPRFGDDARSVLDATRSLDRRDVVGGPKPARVRETCARSRETHDALSERTLSGGASALERALAAGEPLPPATS